MAFIISVNQCRVFGCGFVQQELLFSSTDLKMLAVQHETRMLYRILPATFRTHLH